MRDVTSTLIYLGLFQAVMMVINLPKSLDRARLTLNRRAIDNHYTAGNGINPIGGIIWCLHYAFHLFCWWQPRYPHRRYS